MTELTTAVVRELPVADRGRNLIIEAHPQYLTIRRKGKRLESYSIGWEAVYDCARRRDAASNGIHAPKPLGGRRRKRSR